MLLRNAIGMVVRRHRRDRSKTLERLSGEAKVSLPYLSEIERGRKEASSEVIATICRALGVPLDAFFHEVSWVLAQDAAVLDLARVTPIAPPVSRAQITTQPHGSREVLLAA
jgi:transcriptional regulator with XRE-family HTH domain